MTFTGARLLELLPAVYRIRDIEQGGALRELLDVIAREIGVVEDDLDRLYDEQFIETCAPWAVPYIGDLLGIVGLPAAPLNSRAEVAHTIAYRRRKGTAAVLEQLARDVTGLEARADESFELLATTQHVNHVRPAALATLPVGDATRLERLGGPFERLDGQATLCHIADVRRIAGRHGGGRYNIPNVALFVWRLRAQRLSRSPAVPDAGKPARWFRFSPLGADAPLFNRPLTEDVITHLAEPLDVPEPITRRALAAAFGEYYGSDRALVVERPRSGGAEPVAVPATEVRACDLADWTRAPTDTIAIDPVLGRIAFPADEGAVPLVTFHYGFAALLGGGESARTVSGEPPVLEVAATRPAPFATIGSALAALGATGGVVEVADSGRYEETPTINAANRHVVVRARPGSRPTLVLGGDLHVSGGPGDSATLDGLLITGGAVVVDAGPQGDGVGSLAIRHCTLVPGRTLTTAGAPASPGSPSLTVNAAGCAVRIDRSVTGPVRAVIDARVAIAGGVLDATGDALIAFADPAGSYGAPLRLDGVTVLGQVRTDMLELVSNSVLVAALAPADDTAVWPGPVLARRRQEGCVRFSALPAGSRTPRRYRCQPAREADAGRVRPVFTATRYGVPAYAQLSDRTAVEIRTGADDESELGAFHDQQLPRREAHLRARLAEYLRFGLESDVFHAT
jgi:hypothetical protein